MSDARDTLREEFRRLVEAGVSIPYDTWQGFGTPSQNLWLEIYNEYRLKQMALLAQVVVDTMAGGTLAEDIVYEDLDEATQDGILKKRAHQNAMRERLNVG